VKFLEIALIISAVVFCGGIAAGRLIVMALSSVWRARARSWDVEQSPQDMPGQRGISPHETGPPLVEPDDRDDRPWWGDAG
jgi:hypothetical protein